MGLPSGDHRRLKQAGPAGRKEANVQADQEDQGWVPTGLTELATLWRKRAPILAYFDTGASNGPVEAISGRLEHLRGIALGFRNLDHYILRSLIQSGGLRGAVDAV